MNDLEQMKKKRNRISAIIVILIVLNLLLLLAFATTVGDGDSTGGGASVLSDAPTVTLDPVEGDPNIADVKTGANFTVALDSNGYVWAWGQNDKGQLGNGTVEDSLSKTAVLLEGIDPSTGEHYQLKDVKQIAVGEYHATALTKSGEVYIWGYNYFGQIGKDSVRKGLYPQKIAIPSGEQVRQIECGADYTLALTNSGKIFGLGDSSDGQLGYYNDLAFTSIREIEELKETKELPAIKQISAGYNHIIAVGNDNSVWTWGDTAGSGFDFTTINPVTLPSTPIQVQAGNGVSMALCSDGLVYTWYLGGTPTPVTLPTKEDGTNIQIRTDNTKDNIAIVNQTYYLIDEDGTAYSWGQNNYGQTGNGNTSGVSVPTKLTFNNDTINQKIDKVSSSPASGANASGTIGNYDTAYAINEDGYVLGWGYAGTDIVDPSYTAGSNNGKLLGDGTRYSADYIGSVSVKSIAGNDIVVKVSQKEDLIQMLKDKGYIAGGRVNLYRKEKSSVQDNIKIKSVNENIASYDNATGEITGIRVGKTAAQISSSKNTIYINVTVIDDKLVFPKIETRNNFTVALKADGTVWAWGMNSYLGITDPAHTNQNGGIIIPTQVQGLNDVKDIAVGHNFVLILKKDGTVWSWGQNNYGQLGNGTRVDTDVVSITTGAPTLVQVKNNSGVALSNIEQIKAGTEYAMALDKDGKVWSWGRNDYSQLGLGSTLGYEMLAKETDLSNLVDADGNKETIKQIEAGKLASYILTESGDVYACGYSGNYLCGNSNVTCVYIPTKINAVSKITKISAGTYGNGYAVALTVNGEVWTWGYAGYRKTGYPSQVSGLSNIIDIEATDDSGAIYKLSDGTAGYSTGLYNLSVGVNKLTIDGTEITDVSLINGANGAYIVSKSDGTVWASGENRYGQLGNRTINSTSATMLEDISKAYIALDKYEVTLKVGQTSTINATYNYGFNLFNNEEAKTMEFTSLNEAIATVSGNTISAVKSGKTYVEVVDTDEDSLTYGTKLRVTVNVLSEGEKVTPKVSVGSTHTVSLKSDGTVWVFGYNNYGEIGSTTGKIGEPKELEVSGQFIDVAAGNYYTLLLGEDGKVLSMGYNGYGQLGNNTTSNSISPVIVQKQTIDATGAIIYEDLGNIVKVVAIGNTSIALDKDGNMYAWGEGANAYATPVNTYGLKVTDITGKLILTEDGRVWEYEGATRLKFVKGLNNIVKISSSAYSTSNSYGYFMALDGDGKVYTWIKTINNSNRVTGTETTVPTVQTIDSSIKVVDIEAGVRVAYIIDNDGNVYSWGQYPYALGTNAGTSVVPVKIDTLSNIESVAASKIFNGNKRAYTVTTKGSVYGFGYNGSNSLLGNGETISYYYEPKLVGESYAGFIVDGEPTTRLYMNRGESIDLQASLLDAFNLRLTSAATDTETEFEWSIFNEDLVKLSGLTGTNNKLTAQNIIGEAIVVATDKISGKTAKIYIDVKVTDTKVAPKIESTENHTVSLKADGTVWVWGQNNYGELGILETGNIKDPKQARIAEKVLAATPTPKLDAAGVPETDDEGRAIFVDADGNEYYQAGSNYTDLSGRLVIKLDTVDGKLYKWDSESGNYLLEDLTDSDGNKIVVTDIATSRNHTLMLTNTGDVYSCGYYGNNQLGYYSSTNQYLPKKIDGLKDIVRIAVGDTYSLALDKYGRLWSFGYTHTHDKNNRCYQIINSVIPTKLESALGVDMTEYLRNAVDITNEYLLTKDGEVISLNVSLNTYRDASITPGTKIEGITGKVIKMTRSATPGSTHTAFLTDQGTVYTIGNGSYGQLGNETWTNSTTSTGNKYTAVPVLDESRVALSNIRDIYTGTYHTIAMAKDGSVYTWGNNSNGELRSSEVQAGVNLARAYKVKDDDRIKNAMLVSAGNGFSIVVDETGFAYAWGLGTSGQIGNGFGVSSLEAQRVGIEGIRLDKNHVTLQERGSSIEINAYNKQLNLIYNPTMDISALRSTNTNIATVRKTDASKLNVTPVKAGTTSAVVNSRGDNGEEFTSIIQITVLPQSAEIADDVILPEDRIVSPMTATGNSHTLILKSDGTVLAYGDNTYGQTTASEKYSDKVNIVEFPDGTPSIISVAVGDNFSVALDKEGNVYTWGYNRNGELGLGTADAITHNIPTRVSGLNNIVKVVAGADHCVALDKNGYVYTWGRNVSGSLGIGSTSSISTPVQVNNIASVIDIAAGENFSLALTADGSVYATGDNRLGQLGDEYIISRRNFERVELNAKVTYIEAGAKASAAIDTDGNLWTWGENSDGQLGLGSSEIKVNKAIKCTGINNVQSASVGANHIEVVTSNGELYVAGSNNYGQLGLGTTVEKTNTFAKVSTFGSNVMKANAGTTYSTVIKKDGTVYGFGDYNHGNLDRASFTNSYVPVMITGETSYLDEQEVIVKLGETYKLNPNGKYKVNVLHKDEATFEYTSANDTIASVDDEGVISGLEIGTTMVNAKDDAGKISSVIVKVIPEDALQSPAIEGGKEFAVVTDKLGTSYLFGNKENIIDSSIPKTLNDSISLKTVKAGDDFIVAINNDGTVWTLGDNTYGQLGIEGATETSRFTRLNTTFIKGITQIDAGSNHVIALSELGIVYVWGDNSNGQLGISTATDKVESPTIIRPTPNRVISVSAGGNYSSIVDSAGNVYIIRDGVANLTIPAINGAVKVATGSEKTMVLTNDGFVHLVDNATGAHVLASNKNIVDIATNNNTFMCLTADKDLYTFGNNANGELGVESPSTSNSNLSLAAKDVFTIGGGNTNTYYINTKGEVFATGLNTAGELGNGTRGNSESSTYPLSSTYTKVGSREYNIKEVKRDGTEKVVKSTRVGINWTIFAGNEDVKTFVGLDKTKVMLVKEGKEFNAFKNIVGDTNEYTFELTDTSIADLLYSDKAEITATALGETILKVKNKVTKEEQELKIIIVDDKLLRIEDIYVLDSNDNSYESEPDASSDFIINTEGSSDSGDLRISLEFEDDTLTAEDSEGNPLSITQDPVTKEWIITGLDLTKLEQEVKLTVTSADGSETYDYKVIIRKEAIVKVNAETLIPQDDGNYIKFIDPTNSDATIEVTIVDDTKQIKLQDILGNDIAVSSAGNTVLTKVVDTLEHENEFIIQILDNTGKVERKAKLTILKSSIEEIYAEDITNVPTNVLATRTESTVAGYVDNFYVEIDEKNDPAKVTLNIRNKNVQTVSIDGVIDSSFVTGSSVYTFTTDDEVVEIELAVLDLATGVTYPEKYQLTVHKAKSENGIEQIELTKVNGQPTTVRDPIFKESLDEDYTFEIALHDPDIEVNNTNFTVTLKDTNAKVSANTRVWHDSGYSFSGRPVQITENKYQYTIYVKAENGDVQDYKVVVYKESEDAKIDNITMRSQLDDGSYIDKVAAQKPGTNDFIGKVIKDKSSYDIVIDLRDEYAEISLIEPQDLIDNGVLTLKESSNGKYTYSATPDIIGKTITITTKPEYDGAPTEIYTLTIEVLDDNAEFDTISIANKFVTLDNTVANEALNETIGALDNDSLEVKAVSDYATVEIYDNDPAMPGATIITSGTGSAEADLGLAIGDTKTVYIKITSEDGLNAQVKSLTVKRLSNNAEITEVTFNVGGTIKTLPYVEGRELELPESFITSNPTVTVTTRDPNAVATVEGVDNNIGAIIDLSIQNPINVEVTSEDETVNKLYAISVKILSANAEIGDKEIQDETGAILKTELDFIPDSTGNYSVKVRNTGSPIDLVVKPEVSSATVELGITKKASVPETTVTYVGDRVTLDPSIVTEVDVKITAEDGTVKNYTITVIPEEPILQNVTVQGVDTTGAISITETRTLSNSEILNGSAIVRVHPDANSARIVLETNAAGIIQSVNATANMGTTDEDGNSLEKTGTVSISGATATINVELLDSSISDTTKVVIDIVANDGRAETLVLDIQKGSKIPGLEKVTIKGTTTDDETSESYVGKLSNRIAIDSSDSLYNIIAQAANNGTCKIYEIDSAYADATLSTIDLSLATEVTDSVQLDESYKRFVIEVTAEFGGAKQKYDLYAKKISDNAELTDFTVTVDRTVSKNLVDFGTFDTNNNINIVVPKTVTELEIKDLVFGDGSATAKWTNIIDKEISSVIDSDYTEYATGDKKDYVVVLPTDLFAPLNVKHLYVKVTAENGSEEVYTLNITKAEDNTVLTNTNLHDVTNDTDVINTNQRYDTVKIAETVNDVIVTSTANEFVSIKVTKVNGFVIEDRVGTTTDVIGSNALSLNFDRDYTYIDGSGATKTIPASEVKDITVETTVTSIGYKLYPTYYSSAIEEKYELKIERLTSDKNIVIEVLNADGTTTTTIDTKTTPFVGPEIDENGDIVYTYEYKVPSTQDELVINSVTPNNDNAVVEHRTNIEGVYPYTRPFATVDKSRVEEAFKVTDPLGNSVVYKVIAKKNSGNNDIGEVTVNRYSAKADSTTADKLNAVLSSPVSELNVAITDIEENAIIDMNIKAVNGNIVTVSGGTLTTLPTAEGTKQVEKDLLAQLTDALTQAGIAIDELTNITVDIDVQAEDNTLALRTYTLNIDVIKLNLISIDGLDTTGTIDTTTKLLASDFYPTSLGVFETDVIAVPSTTGGIVLNNILCENDSIAVIKDEAGNDITSTRRLTVSVASTEVTKVKFTVEVDHIVQEYIINIRRRSTDATIREVKADLDRTDILDETLGGYELTIKDTVDPEVIVTLNDPNAKVIDVVPSSTGVTSSVPTDNKFTLSGIAASTHNLAEDSDPTGKTVDVVVTVEAENGNTLDYTIRLQRKHTETGLEEVEFVGDGDKTITFAATDVIDEEISSGTAGITIKSAKTVCNNATVFVEYIDASTGLTVTENIDSTKLYEIEEGTTRTFKLVVVAEYGNRSDEIVTNRYTLNIRRKSSNVDISAIDVNTATKTQSVDITNAPYTAQINVNEDPEIVVTTADPNATVTGIKVYKTTPGDLAGITITPSGNTFSIANLRDLYIDDITEHTNPDNRKITVEFDVQAEDTSVVKTYKLVLTREHIEYGINDISYRYDEDGTTINGTVTLTEMAPRGTVIVKSGVTSVDISKIVPKCDNATVSIKVDGVDTPQTENGFTLDLTEAVEGDGCAKTVEITITSEAGAPYTQNYTIEVIRMAKNASLNKVYVNGIDVTDTREESSDPSIEAIFRADVKDSDPSAIIRAISANTGATVSIASSTGTTYDETITYDLSAATNREITISIVVTPEDTTVPAKTYNLILTRKYDSTTLEQIKIKPALTTGATGEEVLHDDEAHTLDFVKTVHYNYGYSYGYRYVKSRVYYNLSDKVMIPTLWTDITIGDILPTVDADGNTPLTAVITRINKADPYGASELSSYTIDDTFTMPEGEDVYFKVITTAESGSEDVYVIHLYKQSRNTNLSNIVVDGKTAIQDPEDGIYKVNVSADKDVLPITITGENNLSSDKTAITVNVNGTDVTRLLGTTTNGINSKQIQFTLNDILAALDYNTEKIIDVEISVVPEDISITPVNYKVQITRQHTSTKIVDIVLNKDVEVDIDGVMTSVEKVVDGDDSHFTRNRYSLNYEQTVNVTSQLDKVTVSEINLECSYANAKITLNGIEQTLPFDISLPNEGSQATIKVTVTPEYEGKKAVDKYIIIRRMYSDNTINDPSSTVARQYPEVRVDSNGNKYETGKMLQDRRQSLVHYEVNDYTANIRQDQNETVLTLYANNSLAKITDVIVKEVKDIDGNVITTGSELKSLSYATTRYSTPYGYGTRTVPNSRIATIDTTTGRTFIIEVKVQAEDPQIPEEVFTITITKQDDSALISKVTDITADAIDIPVDDEKPHYEYIGKNILDKDIYTKYIDEATTEIVTEITAESKFATVEIYDDDPSVNPGATLLVTENEGVATYTVPTVEAWTRVFVKITAEDMVTSKYYQVWFIKKSAEDDVSISELYVDGEVIPAADDGNYYITISDSIEEIEAKLIPNYKYANVSINGQPYKWQETTEIINNLDKAKLVEGKVRIELRVQIPASQSTSGENETNDPPKYLFIDRVSTDNGIKEIFTDNVNDKVTPGSMPYSSDWGTNNTYAILLEGTGEDREEIDLTIVSVSPKATIELFDIDGNPVNRPEEGTSITYSLPVDKEQVTTYKVKVSPVQGEAKEYYIEITPKASQAELKLVTINGNPDLVSVQPGVYEYHISHLGLTGLGDIYALATANSIYEEDNKYGSATVNIYTAENPSGSGEQENGAATLNNVDLDNTTYITITVESPNKAKVNTYTIWIKDVSDDRTLQQVSYTDIDGTVITVPKMPSLDPDYVGEYEIVLQPEQVSTDISITATSELSRLKVGTDEQYHVLNTTRYVKSMSEDIVLDVIVIAESENDAKYKLTIKKPTIITGKIITENEAKDYSGIEVNIVDPTTSTVIDTAITSSDGTYSIKVPTGANYNMVISKPGYLTYSMTDIPATYGVRRYTGNTYLSAGDVTGDGVINLADLVTVNMKARARTVPDSTNNYYDFNEDGIIDEKDVQILTNNYNKKAESVPYVRIVQLSGEVLDAVNGDVIIPNANITLRETTTTDENGNFEFENIVAKEYTLTVTDATGAILGSENITITEGVDYEIRNNTITLDPNMTFLDITVRVNGARAVISKRGEESSEDITLPKINELEAEVTIDGIKLTAEVEDANLSSITFYTEDGTAVATETLSGMRANVEETYIASTVFNQTHKLYVEVIDTYGNVTRKDFEVTDNIIRKADDLVELRVLVNGGKTYEDEIITLSTDIDLTNVVPEPIGNRSTRQFKGTFDGNGHVIRNMNISTGNNYAGLFGNTNGATIKNLGVEGDIVSTAGYVGGIVGYADNTTIENCYSSVNIMAASNVGGIIGFAKGDTEIRNCYNSADVIATGDTTNNAIVGGIVGKLNTVNATIENCYNIGTIEGRSSGVKVVGGIIGYRSATLDSGTQIISVGTISNCYYLGATSGIGETQNITRSTIDSENDKLNDTTEEITDAATLLANIGAEYKEDVDSLNNGYPVLQWQQAFITTFALNRYRTEISLPISAGYTITSEFDTREHPVTGEADVMHYGMDIATDWQSDVLAIADGTVVFAGENGGYGYCIEIEHVINGEKIYSFYGHLYEIDVEVGDTVEEGQTIGLVGGMPGTEGAGVTTGPHLHLEIRKISGLHSSAVNPRNYLEF